MGLHIYNKIKIFILLKPIFVSMMLKNMFLDQNRIVTIIIKSSVITFLFVPKANFGKH
jgi:hypothetical protein